jgi:hypothetical protein
VRLVGLIRNTTDADDAPQRSRLATALSVAPVRLLLFCGFSDALDCEVVWGKQILRPIAICSHLFVLQTPL